MMLHLFILLALCFAHVTFSERVHQQTTPALEKVLDFASQSNIGSVAFVDEEGGFFYALTTPPLARLLKIQLDHPAGVAIPTDTFRFHDEDTPLESFFEVSAGKAFVLVREYTTHQVYLKKIDLRRMVQEASAYVGIGRFTGFADIPSSAASYHILVHVPQTQTLYFSVRCPALSADVGDRWKISAFNLRNMTWGPSTQCFISAKNELTAVPGVNGKVIYVSVIRSKPVGGVASMAEFFSLRRQGENLQVLNRVPLPADVIAHVLPADSSEGSKTAFLAMHSNQTLYYVLRQQNSSAICGSVRASGGMFGAFGPRVPLPLIDSPPPTAFRIDSTGTRAYVTGGAGGPSGALAVVSLATLTAVVKSEIAPFDLINVGVKGTVVVSRRSALLSSPRPWMLSPSFAIANSNDLLEGNTMEWKTLVLDTPDGIDPRSQLMLIKSSDQTDSFIVATSVFSAFWVRINAADNTARLLSSIRLLTLETEEDTFVAGAFVPATQTLHLLWGRHYCVVGATLDIGMTSHSCSDVTYNFVRGFEPFPTTLDVERGVAVTYHHGCVSRVKLDDWSIVGQWCGRCLCRDSAFSVFSDSYCHNMMVYDAATQIAVVAVSLPSAGFATTFDLSIASNGSVATCSQRQSTIRALRQHTSGSVVALLENPATLVVWSVPSLSVLSQVEVGSLEDVHQPLFFVHGGALIVLSRAQQIAPVFPNFEVGVRGWGGLLFVHNASNVSQAPGNIFVGFDLTDVYGPVSSYRYILSSVGTLYRLPISYWDQEGIDLRSADLDVSPPHAISPAVDTSATPPATPQEPTATPATPGVPSDKPLPAPLPSGSPPILVDNEKSATPAAPAPRQLGAAAIIGLVCAALAVLAVVAATVAVVAVFVVRRRRGAASRSCDPPHHMLMMQSGASGIDMDSRRSTDLGIRISLESSTPRADHPSPDL